MTQRTKLELPVNEATTLELLFDEPISGKSQYGNYNMYAVKVNEEEFTFFPTEEVHEQLKSLKKGCKAVVTKLAAQRGNKVVTTYDVKILGNQSKVDVKMDVSNTQSTEEDKDPFFDLMLQSYRDALNISKELNGMADPEKIAVTLFIARSKSNIY